MSPLGRRSRSIEPDPRTPSCSENVRVGVTTPFLFISPVAAHFLAWVSLSLCPTKARSCSIQVNTLLNTSMQINEIIGTFPKGKIILSY